MPKTVDELERKTVCVCLELPCVHNPEISDDVLTEFTFKGHVTKKGVVYLYIEKQKFHLIEETATIMKVRVDK